MKKYLYEVRPNRPVVNKEGRITRCPFSDLLTKEDVMGYMKSANIWRRFPDGVVRVTGQNLDLLHREKMDKVNSSEMNEENLSDSEVKVTIVEPKEEEVIPAEIVEKANETAKEVVEEPEVETSIEEDKEILTETSDTVTDSLEDDTQVDENTDDSEVEEVKNEAVEESTVVSQEESKKEHQNVVINTGNQNRNIQVNSKNNKNHKR